MDDQHTQAVNVVRFAPKGTLLPYIALDLAKYVIGDMLASAGDDGNTLLWVPSETHNHTSAFGEDGLEEKETWRIKLMCRSLGSEIYDLAWSPDAIFFITGSMDNIARIYNAQNGRASPGPFQARHLTSFRPSRSPDSGTQPFRPRRGLGPVERICGYAVVR